MSALQLVDCGLADKTCANASGKICLIQRGGNTFCSKVNNCAAGGGRAAIIYNSADPAIDDCAPFMGTIVVDGCSNPGIVALALTRLQGTIIKNAMTNVTITATVSTGPGGNSPYEFMSGTSMATPHAAGEQPTAQRSVSVIIPETPKTPLFILRVIRSAAFFTCSSSYTVLLASHFASSG